MTEIAERIAKAGRADALPSFRETEPVSATKEAFYEVLREAREVHDKKGADYGKKHDSFANVRAAEDFGLPAWLGAAIECNNKIHRIQSFYINGRLENEGIEDAFRDMLVYAGIGLCLYREGK